MPRIAPQFRLAERTASAACQLYRLQSQRVGDHGNRAEAHDGQAMLCPLDRSFPVFGVCVMPATVKWDTFPPNFFCGTFTKNSEDFIGSWHRADTKG
jgi:hypothetical protein